MTIRTSAILAGVAAGLVSCMPLSAQGVRLDADLPRVMVFLEEDGVAATARMTAFLREAGFTVIDPAFTRTAAQRELARQAVEGDDGAATALGRNLGAQVLVLGAVPTEDAPSPAAPNLTVGTATVGVRALRLDEGRLVSEQSASGRGLDATGQAARTKAVAQAVEEILYRSPFVGDLLIDWDERPWQDDEYWEPEPGSLQAQFQAPVEPQPEEAPDDEDAALEPPPAVDPAPAASSDVPPPQIAIIESDVYATRSIEIVAAAAPRLVRIRGLVAGGARAVTVGDKAAEIRPMDADEVRALGIESATEFEADVTLGPDDETIPVRARGDGGEATVEVTPDIGERWAVVVGISDYADPRISSLDYADDDARAMAEFLQSPAGGSVPERNLRLLLNEQATAEAIREALFVFLQRAAPGDMVTVYIASHGAPDPNRPSNLYVLTHDTQAGAMAATAFPMWDVKTALRRQIASERVVVIADACRSAGTLVDEANPIGGAFSELFSPSRRLTLSAAGADQVSFEDSRWGGGHGVFTHFLLEGLGGAADADGDGVVTFREAAAYVGEKVPRETGRRQMPEWSGLGDVPMATLRGGS